MVGRIYPVYVPKPAGILGWDGTDFHAIKTDVNGALDLSGKVKGVDRLFSINVGISNASVGVPSGANGYRDSSVAPASTIWVIRSIAANDFTTVNTRHTYNAMRGGVQYPLYDVTAAFGIGVSSSLQCMIVLNAGDFIRVFYVGSLVADSCRLYLSGYSMTVV